MQDFPFSATIVSDVYLLFLIIRNSSAIFDFAVSELSEHYIMRKSIDFSVFAMTVSRTSFPLADRPRKYNLAIQISDVHYALAGVNGF